MTDDKNRQAPTDQEGAPSADQTSTGPEEVKAEKKSALEYAREHPEAIQIAEAALIRKWGAEAGEKFAKEIFRVSPGMLLEVEKRLTEINAEMPKNIKNERVQHNWNRIKMRFVEFVFIRAFFAHIINHLKGIEETQENFYTAYYEILPYIEKEMQKAPDGYYMLREMDIYDGLELPEVTKLWETGEPSGPESQLLINAIRAAEHEKYNPATIKGTDKIDYPVDKPNNNMWDNVWRALKENPDGQLTFSFDVKKRGEKEELPLLVSINFDALQDIEITKRLTPFDKRVYIAISALFNAGNDVITLSTIYKHMGYKGRAGGSDLEKIHKSVLKMLAAQITVDNELEVQRHKKYGHFKYRGTLLPVELGEFYNVQGALTDAAIHILREPPLMTFARNRDQITTVSLKLLQSPVNKTDANLMLEDYLIVQIKRAQKNKAHGRARMLYKTIYKHAGIPEKPTTNTERQQQKRAPGKIEKYLTYYQQEGTITKFTMEKDGITIYW